MNRRQLLTGAIAILGTAILPSTNAQAIQVESQTFNGRITHAQLERIKALYGTWYVLGSVHDDYYVGYNHKLGTLNKEPYRSWSDRPTHMYAGRHTFHGADFESAIVYAETYKRWLEHHNPEPWMIPTRLEARYYSLEIESRHSVKDLEYFHLSVS
jgi:hypothetical protein